MKRFLIVGLGSIGRRHLTNLAAMHPDAHFTVLRHRGGEDELTSKLGARIVTSLDDIQGEAFDLVVVSSPSANHIDVLPRLIAEGHNLLVEKPIVTSLEDCDALTAALKQAPASVRVSGFNFRHIPSLVLLRDHVRDGRLGNIVRASFVAGQWLPDWRPAQDYRGGYSADATRGGGVELDLVHEIDLARWMFGELTLAYAHGGKFSSLEIRAHDTATMIFLPASGAPIIHVALDYVSRQRLRHYELVGDAAGLNWDIGGTLDLVEAAGRRALAHSEGGFDVGRSYVDMLARTFEAIDGAWPEPLQSLEDGIESTRLAILAREHGERR